MFTIPIFGALPDVSTGVVHARLHDDGRRPEHRRRLRGPARPRLRRLLRDGRVHRGLVRVGAVRATATSTSAPSASARTCPGFHISIWLLLLARRDPHGVRRRSLIGLPTLRLRGDYLAIVTLGFGEILPQVARNGDNLFGTGFNLTNGAERDHADRRARASAACTTTLHGLPGSFFTQRRELLLLDGDRARCSSRSSARCGCATRGSAAPGSRSARTRPPRRRWACR